MDVFKAVKTVSGFDFHRSQIVVIICKNLFLLSYCELIWIRRKMGSLENPFHNT